MVPPNAILIRSISGGFDFAWTGDTFAGNLPAANTFTLHFAGGIGTALVITAESACEVEVTFVHP
jgi:hypothetical protein